MTIQALHSDVILHVPDGVYGIILGNIHTDHWRFRHLVPEEDCIIGPMCQFLLKGSVVADGIRFMIQVPHIVKNIHELGEKVKVIHRDNGVASKAKFITPRQDPSEVYYSLNQRYVEISTPHFCKFLVTAEDAECCAGSMTLLTFAKMTSTESGPMANVVAHFCSAHYLYDGYKQVNVYFTDLQNAQKLSLSLVSA